MPIMRTKSKTHFYGLGVRAMSFSRSSTIALVDDGKAETGGFNRRMRPVDRELYIELYLKF